MIDFNKIAQQERKYNFHSHTQFCDGNSEMENFVIEAIEEKFSHYGFSPHSPIPLDSPCNMKKENVSEYLSRVDLLKFKYGDKINLYASMEIDYLNDSWGPSNEYFKNLPLDYKIGSVHFIPCCDGSFVDVDGRYDNFKKKMAKYFDNDIRYVVDTFYKQTIAMIESGGFDIIGHFDKIGHNAGHFQDGIEDEAWYNKHIETTFDAIMDKNIIVEINTKAWNEHNRFFPNLKYFELLNKYKPTIIINSDAHYPTLVNAGRDDAYRLLSSTR